MSGKTKSKKTGEGWKSLARDVKGVPHYLWFDTVTVKLYFVPNPKLAEFMSQKTAEEEIAEMKKADPDCDVYIVDCPRRVGRNCDE